MMHHVVSLMFHSGEEMLKRTIAIYNTANLIILPSNEMADFLKVNGPVVNNIRFPLPGKVDQLRNHRAGYGVRESKPVIGFHHC